MSVPNRNTLWAQTLIEELASSGIEAVCVSPGSRSTPLTVAFHEHPAVELVSVLDERSSGFFALGRGRRTGDPTAVVCTSGTATANLHPAVMEADEGRVPLLVLTADRPPELHDSGANQTTDQENLYGDAVRWYRTLAEPEPERRKLRSLRVTAARAVAETTGRKPGPVHLNIPFRKPLEPTPVAGDVPSSFGSEESQGRAATEGPFVETTPGQSRLSETDLAEIAGIIADADRGLVVCGPTAQPTPSPEALSRFVATTGFPVLADPLSGHRYGPHTADLPICGGYDSYLDASGVFPDPDVVFRFGGSPTSKTLRKYLAGTGATQLIIDPAAGWREAEFEATDLVTAAPTQLLEGLTDRISNGDSGAYRRRFMRAEDLYWERVSGACRQEHFEGAVLHTVLNQAPESGTVFISNSMPIRDADRFGQPDSNDLCVLGNRGVSGIDGVVSSGLGAGSATEDQLVLVLGDLALYHDMNGLLSVQRCGVAATIVLLDNDGGGIFHKLPIESFDPPFTEQFKTPHGIDFADAARLYDLSFERTETVSGFETAYTDAVSDEGTTVVAAEFDAKNSHRYREQLHDEVTSRIREELAR